MQRRVVLKDEKIIDSWSILIENAQDGKDDFYKEIPRLIRDSQVPGLRTEMVKVSSALFGKSREYIMVYNDNLRDYRIYIGARKYGRNLDVSWYLCCEPGLFKRTLSELLTQGSSDKALSFYLNVFKQQDLVAYTTLVHHCVLKAVADIMAANNQDFSKIERKSRGFLGIS